MQLPSLHWNQVLENLVNIGAAYLLALPIGWNWERIRHNTGLRTFPLVAVASCSYVLVAKHIADPDGGNLGRVIQGLMTGIGFVGAGAIFKHGASMQGTSTAASIWCVGAQGAAVACGSWDIAVSLAAVNLVTLHLLRPLKTMIDSRPKERER